MAVDKLIFVYNANSGRINSWLDSAHKIISPSTYQCSLCALTHDAFKEHDEWLRFRESLANEKFMPRSTRYESLQTQNIQLEFLHRDEFQQRYWSKWLPKYDYPIILSVSDNPQENYHAQGNNTGLDIFMSPAELNATATLEELKKTIITRLKTHNSLN